MDLESILRKYKIPYALFTRRGNFVWAESSGEAGKLIQDGKYFTRLYQNYLKTYGLGLLSFLGKNPNFLKNFNGTGVIREDPRHGRVYAAMLMPHATPNRRYIVGNTYRSFSDAIDDFVEDHHWSRNEAVDYLMTEETTHMAHPGWSESKVAESMFRWYMNRASQTKDTETRHKYEHMAEVANKRYKWHCKAERKQVKDLFGRKPQKGHKVHGHDGHGHGHNGHDHGDKGHGDKGGHHAQSQNSTQSSNVTKMSDYKSNSGNYQPRSTGAYQARNNQQQKKAA